MGADAAIGQSKVLREPFLSGEAIVVLPGVAEQHGERHLVAGAEFLGLEQEVRDLGKAAAGGGVGAFEDDVALLEDIADVAFRCVLHAKDYTAVSLRSPVIPYPARLADAGRRARARTASACAGDPE